MSDNKLDNASLTKLEELAKPEVYSEEYAAYIDNRYTSTINEAIRQCLAHEISNDELARRIQSAALDYNAGMREHAEAAYRIEQEEAALAEFDSDLKEQLRVQRAINARIKERTRQLKEEQRNARLSQQLEKEIQRTELLKEQLGKFRR